jgi:hypothetical protein
MGAVGLLPSGVSFYAGHYFADAFFIDGQALTPTSFGEFDATTGVWNPKTPTGLSYGTNGFHLDFADNSSNTATTLGKDSSGNSNNWTPNNLSVTAGAGNDSLVDTPTNGTASSGGDAGGVVVGNYATLNPLDKGSSVTLTNGNLDVSTASTWNSVRATFGITSGKWYWEYTMTAAGYTMVGIGTRVIDLAGYIGQSSAGYAYYSLNGNKWNSGTAAAYGNSFTTNDVIGVAFDADSGKIWFSKNGTWQASGDPAAGTNAAYSSISSATYFPTISQDNSLPATTGGSLNAGSRPFAYAAPSGFKSLNTANLPTPTILKGSDYFQTLLITGANQAYTGLNFSPDFLWFKRRDNIEFHYLFDAVRGGAALLRSNLTDAESTGTTYISAFGSTGFTTTNNILTNSASYAAWCWDAGSSNSTNTAGSITSTVRANASAGFSIVTYTSSGGNKTVGHGLGVAPALVIVKNRSISGDGWAVYHSSIPATQWLRLNTTSAATTDTSIWNSTAPTSGLLSFGSAGEVNSAGGYNYVAYCFAPVAGYSSFGSYTGNGSADGPFVFCGFRPRYLLIKNTSTSGDPWIVRDTARDTYNSGTSAKLAPNESYEENNSAYIGTSTQTLVDFVSNGFKVRSTGNISNTSSYTYIYAAFAENPFSIARAR